MGTGLLNADTRAHAVCMDPAYAPDVSRFARRPEREEQVGLRHDLDERAREALKQEIYASYNTLEAVLEREQSSYKLYQQALADWETQKRRASALGAAQQHDAVTKVWVGKAFQFLGHAGRVPLARTGTAGALPP